MIIRARGEFRQNAEVATIEIELVPHDPQENTNLRHLLENGEAHFAFLPEGEVLKAQLMINHRGQDLGDQGDLGMTTAASEGRKGGRKGKVKANPSEAPAPSPDNENL